MFLELSSHPTLLKAIEQILQAGGIRGWAFGSCWRHEDDRACLLSTAARLFELGFNPPWPASSRGDDEAAVTPAPPVVLSLSGKTEAALRDQAGRLRAHLEARPQSALADVAHSLAATRTRFDHRAAIVGSDRAAIAEALQALSQGRPAGRVVTGKGTSGKVAFVFPGQGTQWAAGWRARCWRRRRCSGRAVEACDRRCAGAATRRCWSCARGGGGGGAGDRVDVVQPALFAVMVSLAAVWRGLGVACAVVGHSQGEIAAAIVAGALTLEDAARVVALRSRAPGAAGGQGAMAAVELSGGRATAAVGWGDRAVDRGGERRGVDAGSGTAAAIDALLAELAAAQVFARKVRVDYASHWGRRWTRCARSWGASSRSASAPGRSIPLYSTVAAARARGRGAGRRRTGIATCASRSAASGPRRGSRRTGPRLRRGEPAPGA